MYVSFVFQYILYIRADCYVGVITVCMYLLCFSISPISVLIAMRVYENGSAALKWTRNNVVVDALNSAFLTALKVSASFCLPLPLLPHCSQGQCLILSASSSSSSLLSRSVPHFVCLFLFFLTALKVSASFCLPLPLLPHCSQGQCLILSASSSSSSLLSRLVPHFVCLFLFFLTALKVSASFCLPLPLYSPTASLT